MRTIFFIIYCLMIVVVTAFITKDHTIKLDGVVDAVEWKGAQEYTLTGGRQLLMKQEGTDLYIALRAAKNAWAHVYLFYADTIRVLHASAALGETRYVKQNDLWKPTQAFNWALRDKLYHDDLVEKQADHYRKFGWVANNNNTGDGKSFEFKLGLPAAADKPLYFACLVAEVPLDIRYFPSSLNDNTVLPALVQGNTPDSLNFFPLSWKKVR